MYPWRKNINMEGDLSNFQFRKSSETIKKGCCCFIKMKCRHQKLSQKLSLLLWLLPNPILLILLP